MNKENCFRLDGVSKSKSKYIYSLPCFSLNKLDLFLIEGARRRRQEGERSCRSQDQQHGELLAKLNDISAQVQHNTEQISELHRRIDTCDEQISIHQYQVYELNTTVGERRALRDALNEAFGFIKTGGTLVQAVIRQQRHIYEREEH